MSSYSKAIGQRASSSASANAAGAAGVTTARQRATAQKQAEAQATRESKRETQRNALIDKLTKAHEDIGRLHGAGDVAGRDKAIARADALRAQLKALSEKPLRAPGRPKSASTEPKAPKTSKQGTLKTMDVLTMDLKPIKQVEGFSFDPSQAMNPYLVHEAYGAHQTRQLFGMLGLRDIKASADIVAARNPGTKPKSWSNKAALTNYILHHVAGEPLAATSAKATKSAKSAAKPSMSATKANAAPKTGKATGTAPKAARPAKSDDNAPNVAKMSPTAKRLQAALSDHEAIRAKIRAGTATDKEVTTSLQRIGRAKIADLKARGDHETLRALRAE